MIGTRTRRLLVVLALLGAGVWLRLAQVQVLEHELWAEEAARLEHSGQVLPYRRGAILDADGVVLARDVEAYHLVLAYRPFRRGHPLGQAAHARAALEMRAVPLAEVLPALEREALALARLTPAELDAFARGGALARAGVPPTEAPEAEARGRRAADVRFYVRGLLGAELREWGAVEDRAEGGGAGRSYLELLADARGVDPDALAAERADAWRASARHLAFLAGRVRLDGVEAGASPEARLDALVARLEASRRAVEGAVAASLFREAAGFPPGRLDADLLLERLDLERVRTCLRWDEADLERWARETRARWLAGWRDGWALPRLVVEATLDPAEGRGPDDVLDHLAALYQGEAALAAALDGRPAPWREVDALAVVPELERVLRADAPEGLDLAALVALPFQDPALRALGGEAGWALLDRARGPLGGPARAETWARVIDSRRWDDRERRHELVVELVNAWEAAFQRGVADVLAALAAAAEPEELDAGGRLRFERGRFDRALERARYLLRDWGGRTRLLDDAPDYDIVYLLSRYPERYPGFEVREARHRVRPEPGPGGRPLAEGLLGVVSSFGVREIQRQRADERRLRELRAKPDRTPVEERELVALVGSVLLPGEERGVSGLEGFLDPELRGRNGYREHRGLEDVFGAGKTVVPVREPEDGADVRLTLVASLQRAAEEVVRAPEPEWDDPLLDVGWFAEPAGAIVLLTPEGDVLAAASGPAEDGPDAAGLERTLTRPTFQPPGSVFKPFVAAWALDRGLDPERAIECAWIDDGGAGYGGVHCWLGGGHGPTDLHGALVGSCNSYFAWLGETCATEDLRGLAHAFGFGRPTGVRSPPSGAVPARPRLGLLEHASEDLFSRELRVDDRRRAGNGLSVVEATPMQVARAFAGLATGRLPSVRLVSAVGAEPLPRPPATPVPLGRDALERVRAALVDVVGAPGGTAHRALRPERLGVALAAKTGSADLATGSSREDGRVRKHTWVAGWLPAEDPALVFVVFVHDTTATSSHGAVYVARQLLLRPEVRGWLAARGVALEEPR